MQMPKPTANLQCKLTLFMAVQNVCECVCVCEYESGRREEGKWGSSVPALVVCVPCEFGVKE